MKLVSIITDRHARESIKDKVELVMAAFLVAGFVYSKIKGENPEIGYFNENVAGVENIVSQYGDDAVYTVQVKEKRK
jgi:hypothetical protein